MAARRRRTAHAGASSITTPTPAEADPELPVYVTLDEVVAVSGVERDVLRHHLRRQGALRRIGNSYDYVDTSVLETAEGALYRRLLRRRLQRALASEGS